MRPRGGALTEKSISFWWRRMVRELSLCRPGKYNSVFDLFHLWAPGLVVPVDGVRAAILYAAHYGWHQSDRLVQGQALGAGAHTDCSVTALQWRTEVDRHRPPLSPPFHPSSPGLKKGGVREKTLLLNSNQKGVRTASVELLEHCIHLQDEKAGRRGRKRESERGAFLSEPTQLTKRKGRRWSKRKSSLLSIKLD